MPTKTNEKTGREYEVTGKKFSWFPLDDDDKPSPEPIVIPLRIKLSVVRETAQDGLNAEGMVTLLSKLIPDQAERLDEMDLNDFQEMFTTWQDEYESLSGASLGESEGSSK